MKTLIYLALLPIFFFSCIGSNDSTISYDYDGELVEFTSKDIVVFDGILGDEYSISATMGRSTDEDYSEFSLVFVDPPLDSMYEATSYNMNAINGGNFFIDAITNEEVIIIENSDEWFRAEFSFNQPTGTPGQSLEIRDGRIDIEK
jgi:hypothetical protein